MGRVVLFVLLFGATPCRAQVYQMAGQPLLAPIFTVSTLPASAPLGAVVYVSDCRAVAAGLATAGTQSAGNGTGCLATFNAAAAAWQVAGTNIAVSK